MKHPKHAKKAAAKPKPLTPQQQHAAAARQRAAKIVSLRHQLQAARHTLPMVSAKTGKTAPVKKQRKRALSAGVPCVAAAVAACLRVPAADVLPFCSGDPDGDLIEDVLAILVQRGLLAKYEEVMPSALPERRRRQQLLGLHETRAGLILGVDLPGPHAVLALDGDWVTWGERRSPAGFPDAVIDEAWAVTW